MLIDRAHGYGGGGGGGGWLTVAAADASDDAKAVADYVCDGVADNVELQAAITEAGASNGHRVVLLVGSYFELDPGLTTTPLTIPGWVTIETGGAWIDWLPGPGVTAPMISVTGNRVTLVKLGLGCYRDDDQIGSYVIEATAAGRGVQMYEVRVDAQGCNGVRLGGGSTGRASMIACDIEVYAAVSAPMDAVHNGGIEADISGCFLSSDGRPLDVGGVGTGGAGRVRGSYLEAYGSVDAESGCVKTATNNSDFDVQGCRLWSTAGPAAELLGKRSSVTDCEVEQSGTSGIILAGSHNRATGNLVRAAGQHGISLTGNACTVRANDVASVSRDTDDTYSGIIVSGDRCLVAGNRVRTDASSDDVVGAGKEHLYGLRIEATADATFVRDNDLLNSSKSGGAGGAYSDAGTNTDNAGNRVA